MNPLFTLKLAKQSADQRGLIMPELTFARLHVVAISQGPSFDSHIWHCVADYENGARRFVRLQPHEVQAIASHIAAERYSIE